MAKPIPKMNAEQILEDIEQQSRDPFRHQLAQFLDCAPDQESLLFFAKSKPDKWAQAIGQLAKLSGYETDKQSIGDTNIYMQINQLPDSALVMQLKEALQAIDQIAPGRLPATIDSQVLPEQETS
jgi:hypothetical protein